ncbi:MAG TPA: GNAT family N-acetyltransferase [Segeticoccus sp.]|nr:GNAT family N-acetyltransferase [Segeticoccus sp.]
MPSSDTRSDAPAVRILPVREQDAARFLAVDQSAFFDDRQGISDELLTAELDWSRSFAATRDPEGAPAGEERLCGVYSSYDMQVTAPGAAGGLARVPMSGLTWVGVHPDQRRRGVLTAMMRHHLHEVHESAEAPLSGLHAAEVGIYGRFGYGVASVETSVELSRGATLTAPAVDDSAATVETAYQPSDSDEAAKLRHEVRLRHDALTLGAVTRPEQVERAGMHDIPQWRRGAEPEQIMFARREGTVTGFAVFNRKSDWTDGHPNGRVQVHEVLAVDAASLLALGRRMLDFDLTGPVSVRGLGTGSPITWWAGGPRAVKQKSFDSLWVRLVDLDRAVAARGYAAPCDVVLEVADDLCPWNAGRWRFTASGDGQGRLARTDDDADLRVGMAPLGAAWLGGRTLAGQQALGLAEELRTGAIRELSRAWQADVAPIGAIGF